MYKVIFYFITSIASLKNLLVFIMMRFASLSPYWFQIIGITGSEKISNDTA